MMMHIRAQGARLVNLNDDDISLVVVATVITVMMMMLRPMHIRALGAGLMRMDGRQLMVGRPTDAYKPYIVMMMVMVMMVMVMVGKLTDA